MSQINSSEASSLQQLIYNYEWSNVNDFDVEITHTGSEDADMITPLNAPSMSDLKKIWGDINPFVVNITTPDVSADAVDTYMNGRWYLHGGKDGVYKITITLRDIKGFPLYRNIQEWYRAMKDVFPQDRELRLVIRQKVDSSLIRSNSDTVTGDIIFGMQGLYLDGISNISYNRETSSAIGVFSITLKGVPTETFTEYK